MENVRIVGTEDDVLVLANESGTRFALAIDEVLRREIRRAQAKATQTAAVTVNPREIQAHIRSGLSSPEVAELLGVSIEDVTRFEGPVLAEREHIIGQALAVPVLLGSEVEPAAQPTFGAAIRTKLAALAATEERWASWKDDNGWMLKLEFTAADVAHDARWSFDPRGGVLAPINADATQLSRQGAAPEELIPRLRALDSDRPSPYKDETRFDIDAFSEHPSVDAEGPFVPARASAAVQEAAMNRAADDVTTSADTADLLEALRRRRGQREPVPAPDDESDAELNPIALFDALEEDDEPEKDAHEKDEPEPAHTPSEPTSRKKRRGAMPSWDEIVFGARTED